MKNAEELTVDLLGLVRLGYIETRFAPGTLEIQYRVTKEGKAAIDKAMETGLIDPKEASMWVSLNAIMNMSEKSS